jgi:hypothetical protein
MTKSAALDIGDWGMTAKVQYVYIGQYKRIKSTGELKLGKSKIRVRIDVHIQQKREHGLSVCNLLLQALNDAGYKALMGKEMPQGRHETNITAVRDKLRKAGYPLTWLVS